MKTALMAVLSGALILGGSAHAAKKAPAPKPNKKAQTLLVCPVAGEKIASEKAASGKSTYKGKTYFFCCGGCKPEFDKNPGFYASKYQAKLDKIKKDEAKASKDKKHS